MALSKPSSDIFLDSVGLEIEPSDQRSQEKDKVDEGIFPFSTNSGIESCHMYLCNICNINVPQMCMKEHIISSIHKNCEKIFQHFLERAKLPIINNSSFSGNKESRKDLVYCTHCSKVIIAKDEILHYSSNDHLNSLKRVTLLNNFMKEFIVNENKQSDIQIEEITNAIDVRNVFENSSHIKNDLKRKVIDNNGIDVEKHDSNNIGVKKQKLNEKKEFKDDINAETENQCKDNKLIDNDVKILTLKTNVNETDKCKIMKDYIIYLKEINAEYIVKFKFPIVDFITVESNDSNKIKVTVDAFHSYKRFNNYVYCQLCSVLLPPETKREHSVTEGHVRRVVLPLNINFARQITNSWKHCLVCNEMVVSDSKHANNNPKHKMLAKIILSETDYKEINDNETCFNNYEQNRQLDQPLGSVESSSNVVINENHQESATEIIPYNKTDTSKKKIRLLSLLNSDNSAVVNHGNLLNSLPIDKLDDNNADNSKINDETNLFSDTYAAIRDNNNNQNQQDPNATRCFDQTVDNTNIPKQHNSLPYKNVKLKDSNAVINNKIFSNFVLETVNHTDIKYQDQDTISERIMKNNDNNNQIEISLPFVKTVNKTIINEVSEILPNTSMETVSRQISVMYQNQPESNEMNNLIENNAENHNNEIDFISNQTTTIVCDANITPLAPQITFSNSVNDVQNTVEIIKKKCYESISVFDDTEIVNQDSQSANFTYTDKETVNQDLQSANFKYTFDTINDNAKNLENDDFGLLIDFPSYLKEITVKFGYNNLPIIENNNIVVETPNANKINVDVNTFHSFKKINDSIVCQICQEWISDVRAHSFEVTHIYRIILPVDNNFARRVNNEWNHCLLCNIIVLNNVDHVTINPKHNQVNMDQMEQDSDTAYPNNVIDCDMNEPEEIYNEKNGKDVEMTDVINYVANSEIHESINEDSNVPNTFNSNETVNKVKVNEETRIYIFNIKDIIVKYNLNINLPFLEGIFKNKGLNEKDLFEYFHSYKCINESMYCQLCQLWILSEINVHSGNERHLKYISQPVGDNFLRKVNESSLHCLICNEIASDSNPHLAHNDLFEGNDTWPTKTNTVNNIGVFCRICNMFIETTDFKVHMDSKDHIDNIVKYIDNESDNKHNFEKVEKMGTTNDSMIELNLNKPKESNIEVNLDNKEVATTVRSDNFNKTDSIKPINDSKEAETNIKINLNNKMEAVVENNVKRIPNQVAVKSLTNKEKNEPGIKQFNTNIHEFTNINFRAYESVQIVEFRYYLNAVINRFKLKKLPRFVLESNSIGIISPSGFKYNVSIDTFHGFKCMLNNIYCQVCRRWIYESKLLHTLSKRHVDGALTNSVNEMFIRKTHGAWYHCIMCNVPLKNIVHHVTTTKNHRKCNNYDTIKNKMSVSKYKSDNTSDQVMIYCDDCDRYIDANNFTAHTKGVKHITNRNKNFEKNVICIDSSDEDDNVANVKANTEDIETNTKAKTINTPITAKKSVTIATTVNKNYVSTVTVATVAKTATTINRVINNRANDNSATVAKSAITINRAINNRANDNSATVAKPATAINRAINNRANDNLATVAKRATTINRVINNRANNNLATVAKRATTINRVINNRANDNSATSAETKKLITYESENASKIKIVNDFREYLNDITKKFNKKIHFVCVQDNEINISTPSGQKAIITVNDFHSFRNPEKSLFCQVCQMYVYSDKAAHIQSKPHVEHISQPLDNNFVRKINNAWSHCVVCNQMVFRGIDHVNLSNKHNECTKKI